MSYQFKKGIVQIHSLNPDVATAPESEIQNPKSKMVSDNAIFGEGREALEKLQQASANPILVKFVAPHCPACETLSPVLQQLASDSNGRTHLVTIDMTEDPELAIEMSIRSAPTVVLMKGGTVVEKIVGLKPKKFYSEVIQKAL